MGTFLRRLIAQLGVTGLIIVVAALVFGVVAGGVVVHRLEASPAASQEGQQGEASDQKDEGPPKGQGHGHGNGHATGPETTEPQDSQEND